MTVQNNIHIVRRNFRWNVDEPELQTLSPKIKDQRPVRVPITIPAHDYQRRTNRLQVVGDCRLANVAQVPNLIRLVGKIHDHLWQLIVSIGQNENFHSAESPNIKTQIPEKLQCPMIKALPARAHFRSSYLGAWNLFGIWVLGFGV